MGMHIRKITEYLSYRADIELHIITFGNKNRQFKKGNLNVHTLKDTSLLPFPFSIPFSVWHLRRKTIELNPDIVHAEGTSTPYSTAAALLRHRYPTLVTALVILTQQIKFYRGMNYIFAKLVNVPNARYVISKIPNIIAQSWYTKNVFSKMTNSKIYVVPGEGIDFGKIQDTQPHDINEKISIFIAVRLGIVKGIDILINAIPGVIKSVPDLKVYIAGAGEEEEKLKSMTKDLGLESHVRFLGFIYDEEQVNRYYKTCEIVVVPSRLDVEPFAPLNAAASGKPAIVSDKCDSSVIEDGKTGFIFKSEDVDELSGKIVKLLTDGKLRKEMGKAAMEKAKEYDWARTVDKKVEIYKEVIADFYERRCNK